MPALQAEYITFLTTKSENPLLFAQITALLGHFGKYLLDKVQLSCQEVAKTQSAEALFSWCLSYFVLHNYLKLSV